MHVCVCVTCGVGRRLVFSQRTQCTAGGPERSAARAGTEPVPDRVVLERVALAARVKVRVRRRLHRRHARVVRVQIRVIHFVHVEGGMMETQVCVKVRSRSVCVSRCVPRLCCSVCL